MVELESPKPYNLNPQREATAAVLVARVPFRDCPKRSGGENRIPNNAVYAVRHKDAIGMFGRVTSP